MRVRSGDFTRHAKVSLGRFNQNVFLNHQNNSAFKLQKTQENPLSPLFSFRPYIHFNYLQGKCTILIYWNLLLHQAWSIRERRSHHRIHPDLSLRSQSPHTGQTTEIEIEIIYFLASSLFQLFLVLLNEPHCYDFRDKRNIVNIYLCCKYSLC